MAEPKRHMDVLERVLGSATLADRPMLEACYRRCHPDSHVPRSRMKNHPI